MISLRHERALSLTFAATWLLALGLLQWSVVRFRIPIVLGLTLAAVLLAVALASRRAVIVDRVGAVVTLLGSALILAVVPMFSYLTGPGLISARVLLVCYAVLAAGLVALGNRWKHSDSAIFGLGLTLYAAVTAIAIRTDPAPKIDVWVTLQQAADGMLRGENMYAMQWTDSPGIQDAFTYLPWTAALLAPGRWLFGDVRWALGLIAISALVALWLLGRSGGGVRWRAAYVVALLAAAPGTLTQIDQAWTEPLLFAGLMWWLLLVVRGRPWLAIIPLALVCASKQHLALLLPILLVWKPFGIQRTIATGALTGVLIAPWFIAGPADFIHDTITLLIGFHPIKFANTWYLLALNEFGVTLPFWVTGVVVLGTLATAIVIVAQRQPDPAELLRWLGFVLLAANLVNKQAFYNQFWLCAALVAASVAVAGVRVGAAGGSAPAAGAAPIDSAGGQVADPSQPARRESRLRGAEPSEGSAH